MLDQKRSAALDRFLHAVHDPMLQLATDPVDSMQAFMMNNDVIREVKAFLDDVVHTASDFKACRTFLCAYLISFHGSFLFQDAAAATPDVKSDEESLKEIARKLIDSITAHGDESLPMLLKAYLVTFRWWQSKDQPKLAESLQHEYRSMEAIKRSLPDDNSRAEWLPFVIQHQHRIKKHLKRIGVQVPREGDLEEEQASKQLPNVQIAHELYLDSSFGFKNMLRIPLQQETLDSLEAIIEHTSAAEKVQLVGMFREGLIDVCPEREKADIEQRLSVDDDTIDAFDWAGLGQYALELMGHYCSEARDGEVAALRREFSYSSLVQLLFNMRVDMSNFRLDVLRKRMQAGELVDYEHKWFAEHVMAYEGTRQWLNDSPAHEPIQGVGERTFQIANALGHMVLSEYDMAKVETLCLDKQRILKWRELAREILAESIRVLMPKNSTSRDTPAFKLLHKRLREVIVRACCFKTTPTISKMGFIAEDALREMLHDIGQFFQLHIQVHRATYDSLLAQ